MSKEHISMAKHDNADPPGRGGGKPDNPGGGQSNDPKPKEILIEVNDKDVTVEERELTGAEIKAAAIAQGVTIQPNFALYHDRANGTSEPIVNDQTIRVHPRMAFTAIAADDNS
jgi:hypothetical protein